MRYEKQNVTIVHPYTDSERCEALVDTNRPRVAYVREEADTHYAGTFGRETPIYGSNPHGAAWYRLQFEPTAIVGDCAGAWIHSKDRAGTFVKIIDGQLFRKLEKSWSECVEA